MGVFLWIIFGALVGWIASMVMETNEEQGTFLCVTVGIIGALAGGLVANLFGIGDIFAFSLSGIIAALIGAIILIGIVKLFLTTSKPGE